MIVCIYIYIVGWTWRSPGRKILVKSGRHCFPSLETKVAAKATGGGTWQYACHCGSDFPAAGWCCQFLWPTCIRHRTDKWNLNVWGRKASHLPKNWPNALHEMMLPWKSILKWKQLQVHECSSKPRKTHCLRLRTRQLSQIRILAGPRPLGPLGN